MEDGGIRFIHPIKDIDSWIQSENQGMSLMLNDVQKMEMKIRRKQLEAEEYGLDEYDDDEFVDMAEEHEKLTAEIEQKNAATHRNDAAFRKLKPEQQRQLEEDMQVSIVRNNASSEYNKTDDEIFGDRERSEIIQRLTRLRNIYYDAMSYRAAITTIREAIEYSLKHDYPWLSYDEAVKEFNNGKIKYMGNVPKLYLGFGTDQVTDPQVLSGIVAGKITVVDKDEEDKKLRQKRKEKQEYEPVSMDYTVIREKEYKEYVRLHNMGYDTPISVILKSKSQLFDRLSMPFSFVSQTQEKPIREEDLVFDWMQPNAGEVFYCQEHGIQRNTQSNLISMLNKENNNELNHNVQTSMQEFINAFNHPTHTITYDIQPAQPIQPTDQALAMEQNLLAALRANNPNM